MEYVGWISSILLMCCGIPEAWKAYKEKKSTLSDGLIIMWGLGEVLGLVYVITLGSLPLIANYLVNCVSVGVIAYYKYRKTNESI